MLSDLCLTKNITYTLKGLEITIKYSQRTRGLYAPKEHCQRRNTVESKLKMLMCFITYQKIKD